MDLDAEVNAVRARVRAMHKHAVILSGIFVLTALLGLAVRALARWADRQLAEWEDAENSEWE